MYGLWSEAQCQAHISRAQRTECEYLQGSAGKRWQIPVGREAEENGKLGACNRESYLPQAKVQLVRGEYAGVIRAPGAGFQGSHNIPSSNQKGLFIPRWTWPVPPCLKQRKNLAGQLGWAQHRCSSRDCVSFPSSENRMSWQMRAPHAFRFLWSPPGKGD